jgi:hypothetical protein
MSSRRRSVKDAARFVAILVFAALAACTSAREVSFKSITFEKAPRDLVFGACRDVVSAHYYSAWIHADPTSGLIETDPVEESVGKEILHQQVYVRVDAAPNGEVLVELMATLARLEVDPAKTPAAAWRVFASDVLVEGRLLDEISGRVLSLAADARVVASTIPKEARSR